MDAGSVCEVDSEDSDAEEGEALSMANGKNTGFLVVIFHRIFEMNLDSWHV